MSLSPLQEFNVACLPFYRFKVVIGGGDTRNDSNEEERAIKYIHTVDSISDKTSESAAVCQYFMSLLKAEELCMQTSAKDEVRKKKIIFSLYSSNIP